MEEEEDDRSLHQRLFSQTVEPCVYPEPPTEEELMKPQEDADSWRTDESQESEEASDYNTEWQWQMDEETPGGASDETEEMEQPLEEQADNGYEPETEGEGEPEPIVSNESSGNTNLGMPSMEEPEQTTEITEPEDEEVILNPEEKE